MASVRFTKYFDPDKKKPFDRLLEIFLELVMHTSGDVDEALDWMRELDNEYNLTNEDYTLDDFIDELREKGYLRESVPGGGGRPSLSPKTEQALRHRSMDQLFGKMRRSQKGGHRTGQAGTGDDSAFETRPFEFGDRPENIAYTESIRNAQINHGPGDFKLTDQDLEVWDTEHQAQCSTVLMIDISHSMILYGEDRITPAKKVALALAGYIQQRYPKDTLDIVVFGNDAWEISVKEIPYLKVGPYHTNTVAGLELAMDLLRRRRNPNKQIFMITDGKPSCIKVNGEYYRNSFGLDQRIVNKTLTLASQCRKLRIPITTFMIASDTYLRQFVEEFTEANNGKAIYTGLGNLGETIMSDYENNRKKRR